MLLVLHSLLQSSRRQETRRRQTNRHGQRGQKLEGKEIRDDAKGGVCVDMGSEGRC